MRRSTVVSFLVAVVGFGILVPWWKGIEFLDSTVILASAAASLVFVAPMIASSFQREHIGRQVLSAVGFAWVVALLILTNGIATVNLQHWLGSVVMPPAKILAASLLLNLCGALFIALVTMEAALRTGKPAIGVRNVRIGFFLLLAVLVYVLRFAPPELSSRFDGMLTTQGLTRAVFVLSGVFAVASGLLWVRVKSLSRS
jgi:hypothetical protein